MSDWEEIKRLAADFQRTQESDSLQRISESNCIDILKLCKLNLVYSRDGREVVTLEHLLDEIETEVAANDGRVQLHELVIKLNVDYHHVEERAKHLALSSTNPGEYSLVDGQLIHSSYQSTLAKHVKDTLNNGGYFNISELSKNLDLPTELLSNMIASILKNYEGVVPGPDNKTYYTEELMEKYKSILVGTLAAIIKPINLSVLARLNIPDKIFNHLLTTILKDGTIDAHLESRQLIPAIYTRQRREFIDKFYTQNLYVEYEVVSRLNIKQPKVHLKKQFPDCVLLSNICINPALIDQTASMIEDTVENNTWLDTSTILPSCFEEADIELMISESFKRNNLPTKECIIFGIFVCSRGFLALLKDQLAQQMTHKAEEDLTKGILQDFFIVNKIKVEDEKTKPVLCDKTDNLKVEKVEVKSRKSGGGTQGREIKQKAVKKKYIPANKKNDDDEEMEVSSASKSRSNRGRASRRGISPEHIDNRRMKQLIFMSNEQMIEGLKATREELEECSDDLLKKMVSIIEGNLNEEYIIIARQKLDEYLRKQAEKKDEDNCEDNEIEIIE